MDSGGFRFRRDYLFSIPGFLRGIELLCDFLGLVLGAAGPDISGYTGHKGFFIFVTVFALIVTLLLLLLAVTNIQGMCLRHYWPILEIGWCALITLFYFIGSIVIAVAARHSGVFGAAAFFGFAAFLTYSVDGIYRVRMRLTGADRPTRSETYAANQGSTPSRPPPTY